MKNLLVEEVEYVLMMARKLEEEGEFVAAGVYRRYGHRVLDILKEMENRYVVRSN